MSILVDSVQRGLWDKEEGNIDKKEQVWVDGGLSQFLPFLNLFEAILYVKVHGMQIPLYSPSSSCLIFHFSLILFNKTLLVW